MILADIRYSIHALARRPGFTAIAVVTLALGIGANTAIFSLVRSVILKPLPFREPDRLVRIYETHGKNERFQWGTNAGFIVVRPGTLHDWREQSRSFESIEAVRWRSKTLTGGERAESVWANEVTEGFFRTAGVAASIGRTLQQDDFASGAPRAVIISDRLWRNRFGSDRRIVGREMLIDGAAVPIAGVMPPGFYPDRYFLPDLWLPYPPAMGEATDRTSWKFITLARLKPGVTLEQACQDLDVVSSRLSTAHPDHYGNMSAVVVPVAGEIVGPYESLLFTLLGAVGLVLLIACVNVANLMLVRAAERTREFALRAALGAPRSRMIGQLLTESVLLACFSGGLGIVIAKASLPAVLALLPTGRGIPRMDEAQLDWAVLAFTFVVSLATGVLFGLAPAWRAALAPLSDALKDGSRGAGVSRGSRRFGKLLIAGEVALSLVLLSGAGLLLRSFWLLHQVDSGVDTENVLAMNVTVPDHRYGTYETGGPNPQRAALFREIERQVAELPGVESAAVASHLPLKHGPNPWSISIEGRGAPPEAVRDGTAVTRRKGLFHHGSISIERVSPGYFRTLGLALVRGRYLDHRDTARAPLVTVVNETFVRRFFPDEDPIGRRITVDMTSYFPKMTIVGVVADNRMHGLDRELYPLLFWSIDQYPSIGAWVIVKSRADPTSIGQAVQTGIRQIDSDLAIKDVATMPAVVAESLWRQRFATLLIGSFAALALLLATAGIYGVISYSVSQRTHEIGLRMTLGATRGQVVRMVVFDGLRLSLSGAGAGLLASFSTRTLLAGQLYGVSSSDPGTLAAVSSLLIVVSALAAYIPARRVLQVDPAESLRRV